MPANKEWKLDVEGKYIYLMKKKVTDPTCLATSSTSGIFVHDAGPLISVRAQDEQKVKVRMCCTRFVHR